MIWPFLLILLATVCLVVVVYWAAEEAGYERRRAEEYDVRRERSDPGKSRGGGHALLSEKSIAA